MPKSFLFGRSVTESGPSSLLYEKTRMFLVSLSIPVTFWFGHIIINNNTTTYKVP